MKKLVHDKRMVILLILATTVTVIMVLLEYKYEVGLNSNIVGKLQDKYAVLYRISVLNMEDIEVSGDGMYDIEENTSSDDKYRTLELPSMDGNIILKDYFNLVLDDSLDWVNPDIYLKYSEIPLEELASGRYPTVDEIENGEHLIVMGKAWLPFVTMKDDKMYIGIDNENYKVVGIFEDNTQGAGDERIYMFFDSMSDKQKKDIVAQMGMWCELVYKSQIKTGKEKRLLDNWLKKTLPETNWDILDTVDEEAASIDEITEMIFEISKYIAMFIYTFGVVSCFSVSKIWAKRRTKELMIRMALGESKVMLGLDFCFKLLVVQMAGTLIAFGVMYISAILGDTYICFTGIDIKGLVMQLILIFTITAIIPFFHLKYLSPAQGLQKW